MVSAIHDRGAIPEVPCRGRTGRKQGRGPDRQGRRSRSKEDEEDSRCTLVCPLVRGGG